MTLSASHCTYNPRITFQDTNVVGNVYFLSYFRWQFECFEKWRREQWIGRSQKDDLPLLFPTRSSTSFCDPFGATVGDYVQVTSEVHPSNGGCSTTSTIKKLVDGTDSVLATGTIVLSNQDFKETFEVSDRPVGPSYEYRRPYFPRLTHDPLELLSLQGKCRELFLLDNAPETIRKVASQDLALQTTSASVEILRLPQKESAEVRVELRLEALKCGQMTVRFDYFFDLDTDCPVHFAHGQQRMSCKRRYSHGLLPTPLPLDVLGALRQFTDDGQLLEKITEIERFSERTPQPHISDCAP